LHKRFLFQGNRTLDRRRPFANSIGNEDGNGRRDDSSTRWQDCGFCRLIFAPSAISFAIAFGEVDPPLLLLGGADL
jgi:hypothetical protein